MLTPVRFVARYPWDLVAVSVGALFAYWLVTNSPDGHLGRRVVALAAVGFLPGFALVSAIFPARERAPSSIDTERSLPGGVDGVERLGLSVALSITCCVFLALLLTLSPWGLSTSTAAGAIAVLTVGFAQVGAVRRLRLAPRDRYRPRPVARLRSLRGRHTSGLAMATTVLLVLSMIAATLTLAVALSAPPSASDHVELGLYTEGDDGTHVAGGFPSSVEDGESIPFVVGVSGPEASDREFEVIVQEERSEELVEHDRFDVALEAETTHVDRAVVPVGDDTEPVRIAVLLYETTEGSVPDEPTRSNADQEAYFWTTVEDEEEE